MLGRVLRQFRQVDVFTTAPFLGNPVAVVLDAEGLDAGKMQTLARWTNLSETTFVLPATSARADYQVRIFTPDAELPFAGHPTLGTCHAWREAGGAPTRPGVIVQQCAAGLINLRETADGLAFEAPPLLRSGPVDECLVTEIAAELGIGRADIVDAQWASRDIGVAGPYPPGSPQTFEVRAFTPKLAGSNEDPVTGSFNASLAQWLLRTGRASAPYVASQGTALGRRGRVHISADPDGTVWVGGGTLTCVTGTVDV